MCVFRFYKFNIFVSAFDPIIFKNLKIFQIPIRLWEFLNYFQLNFWSEQDEGIEREDKDAAEAEDDEDIAEDEDEDDNDIEKALAYRPTNIK